MRRKNSDLKDSTTASHAAAWRQQLHSRLKEGVLIALGALCLYLWMALLTYDPADPSWSHSSQVDQVQNAAGRLGAVSADILFMTLGYFAYLFPLLLGIKTWQVFRRRNLPWEWNTWLFSWRLVGLIFLILAGSALAYIHFHASGHMPASASAGGAIGQSLGRVAVDALNVQGSTLVFFALFLFGLTVFADLSWFKVMDVTGKITLDFFELIQNAFNRWMGARAERKQLVAQLREVDERVAEVVAPSVPDRREQSKAKERLLEREEALAKHMSEREKRPPPKIDPPPPPKAPEPSKRVLKEKQAPLFVDTAVEGTLPPLSLLDPAEVKQKSYSPESLEAMSRLLEIKLKEFGVEVSVDSVHPGPVITRFEIQPAAGVKVSRISNLAKDLARSLAVISVRVVEVIPGKTTVGIEIPNEDRQMVRFSEVLSSPEYDEHKSTVPLALGHDIGGRPIITDLAKMPHLLVAGTTGSGKSVGVNAMLLSILFKSTPSEARLIMIDPKMLELSIYEGIPHLLCPVVTDMKEAANALRWSVAEMERRYRLMAAMGVRNLAGFNRKVKDAEEAGTPLTDPLFRRESPDDEPPQLSTLPTIVVVVDEFADMMMIVGKKVEELIARIAQKARAARYPPDPGDPAAVGGRDHRPDQGQHPDPDRLPGLQQDRLAHHPRPGWRRTTSRPRRHALPAAGHRPADSRARRLRFRRRGAPGGRGLEAARRARLHRGHPRWRRRRRQRWRFLRWRRRLRRRQRGRPALRRGGTFRHRESPGIDLRRATQAEDRLQPRRADDRGDGDGRRGHPDEYQRLPRSHRAGAGS